MKKYFKFWYFVFWYFVFIFIVGLVLLSSLAPNKYRVDADSAQPIQHNVNNADKVNDTYNARSIIGLLLPLAKANTTLFEADDELHRLCAEIPQNISPHEKFAMQSTFLKSYMAKMCDLELESNEIYEHFTKIKYNNCKINLEHFIELAHLQAEYCNNRLELANIMLKNNQYSYSPSPDNLSMARLLARIRKELNIFDLEVQNIFPKLQQFLNKNEKEYLKLLIEQTFSKEIDKYKEAYSIVEDSTKICMFLHERPIISMYLCTNNI